MIGLKDEQLLKSSWEHFIYHRCLDVDVDPIILASWQRAKAYGVNPEQKQGQHGLNQRELQKLQYISREIIMTSLSLMEQLYELVKGSGFMVTLCDPNGILIKVIGDQVILQEAEKILFVEGADWSEEVMGTNAIGTCIKLDRPLQVYAAEHFSRACHFWTCSAAPIHNPNGDVVGVLNMSGPFQKVNAHTLGMVVSAVWAIENHLRVLDNHQKNEVIHRYLEATVHALQDSVAIVDDAGHVLKVNPLFLHMFGLHEEKIKNVLLQDLLRVHGHTNLFSGQQSFLHKEFIIEVKDTNKMVRVLTDVQPIFSLRSEKMGYLITFKEMKKVRQFVNHMTDSRAKIAFPDIIGKSRIFLDAISEAKLSAKCDATVLLMGESGTGKDLFAQAIHHESVRRNKPFIAINCGAIPRDLLGSELFGYVDGAFTGARKGGSAGKFELADGGSLFLDEIGEMSLEMQVLLLRVLQTQEITRIGGHEVIPVDVRIIAATNKDLAQEVSSGHFRADLFYRLHVMPIRLPALRDRQEDIPLFAEYFITRFCEKLGKGECAVSDSAMQELMHADWPGNVRELQNVLERAVIRSSTQEIVLHSETKLPSRSSLPVKESIKREALIRSIEHCRGNFKEAAKYLGISRSTLYRQLEKYGLRET